MYPMVTVMLLYAMVVFMKAVVSLMNAMVMLMYAKDPEGCSSAQLTNAEVTFVCFLRLRHSHAYFPLKEDT